MPTHSPAGELSRVSRHIRELWLTDTPQDADLFSAHSAETFSTSKNLAAQCINVKLAAFFLPGRSLESESDLLRPVQEVQFLAAHAIGFACSGLAIPHRHPGAQRARGVVRLTERNSGNSETGCFLLREPQARFPAAQTRNRAARNARGVCARAGSPFT